MFTPALSFEVKQEIRKIKALDPKRSARNIAKKSPSSLRRAKEAMNAIDTVDVKRSYRMEQGFTYELHVRGVADEQRAAFVEKRDADTTR